VKRIIFMDPETLDSLKARIPPEPDPELETGVDEALKRLRPDLQLILRMRFYEGVPIREIADQLDRTESDISCSIYEARRQMKVLLAEFAKNRWGLEIKGLCKICVHPQKSTIEKIIAGKKNEESWKKIIEKIYCAVGERFQPPQVLKAHLRHIKPEDKINDE
jgi:IS30 family transposase